MKFRVRPMTLVCAVILLGALVAVALLLPGTLESGRVLERERNATPTPTAEIASMLAVTIDPNNTPSPTPVLLKTGTEGDEVRRLQQRLKDLQYYNGEVDGQYGQATAEAVRVFQAQHGLEADGLAGQNTLSALYADTAQVCIPTPSPSPTPGLLSRGDEGEAVLALQTRLQELGFYTGKLDGDFGGGTENAVRSFQRQHELDVDGMVAEKTNAVLFSDQAQTLIPTPTPDPNALPLLVNAEHPVGQDYRPDNLVLLRNALPSSLVTVKGSEIEGDATAVAALEEMFAAAVEDGVTGWQISAGYRSYAYQQQLFDEKVASYRSEGFSQANAVSATRQTVAEPGTSEHHTGLAFDITVAGVSFKGTEQQIWLHEHCWDYGFIVRYQEDKEDITGFLAECWHIRYVGLPHSTAMRDANQCLEEYLGAV